MLYHVSAIYGEWPGKVVEADNPQGADALYRLANDVPANVKLSVEPIREDDLGAFRKLRDKK